MPQPEIHYEKKPRTITPQNCSYLMGLCLKLAPESVIEIGTGVSTEVMAEVDSVQRLWTGDRDAVDLSENQLGHKKIRRFLGESTAFLASLEDKADLFFLDARLYKEDVAHIKRLSKPHSVYVLDDFEGIEKGVSNAFLLVDEDRMLMQPVDGKFGRSTLAALIPKNLIRLVNQ